MAVRIDLYKKSAKTLRFTIVEVPDGRTVDDAVWMLKSLPGDEDFDSHISKSVTASVADSGQITDIGATGTATVEIEIDEDDMDGLDVYENTRNTYVGGLKVTLDNGKEYIVPGTISEVRIHDGVVGIV